VTVMEVAGTAVVVTRMKVMTTQGKEQALGRVASERVNAAERALSQAAMKLTTLDMAMAWATAMKERAQ